MRAAPPGFAALLRMLPVSQAAKCALRVRLCDTTRHYHGAWHVALLWRRHCQLGRGEAVSRPRWNRLLACAIAFHDAVHDPRRADNEAASAALWRRWSRHLPMPERDWVARVILATADHLADGKHHRAGGPASRARAWMLDLDLSPLGERPSVFAANGTQLRMEFEHLHETEWDAGQRAFLKRMARAVPVYRGRKMRARFASRARANLARALSGDDAALHA